MLLTTGNRRNPQDRSRRDSGFGSSSPSLPEPINITLNACRDSSLPPVDRNDISGFGDGSVIARELLHVDRGIPETNPTGIPAVVPNHTFWRRQKNTLRLVNRHSQDI